MYIKPLFHITRRTFLSSKGLVKARSFKVALEQHDAYRIKLINYSQYQVRCGVMAVNPDKRTVYFAFHDRIEDALRLLEVTDSDAMPLVTFPREDLRHFHPDSVAHNLCLFNSDEYHYWWCIKRSNR